MPGPDPRRDPLSICWWRAAGNNFLSRARTCIIIAANFITCIFCSFREDLFLKHSLEKAMQSRSLLLLGGSGALDCGSLFCSLCALFAHTPKLGIREGLAQSGGDRGRALFLGGLAGLIERKRQGSE